MSVAKVKGVAFRSVLASLEELRGKEGLERTFAQLEEEARAQLRFTVINTGWYPITLYRTLLEAVVRDVTEHETLLRRIGALSIRRDVTGVYRVFIKIFSPEFILGLSSRLFNNYYDTGTLEITEQRTGFARAEYRGCAGFDRNMWIEILGSCEELLTIGGGKQVRASIVRGGSDAECVIEANWR